MMEFSLCIHIAMQIILICTWVYTIANIIKSGRYLPLGLFGLLLVTGVVMIYIISTNLLHFEREDLVVWRRIEWYIFDFTVAFLINNVLSIAKKINTILVKFKINKTC